MSTDVQTVVKVDNGVVPKPPPTVGGGKSHRDSVVKRAMNFNLSSSTGTAGGTVKQQQPFPNKFQRKRQQSGSSGGGGPGGNKLFPPYKKRKKDALIPPTKFLLGGNIRDPLNLNSLQDEEVNRKMNAVTPESSPLPTPQHRKGEVEVIIPADIHDPLSLAKEEDNDAYAASFNRSTPVKRKGKKKKKRGSGGPGKITKDDSTDFKSDESKSDDYLETEPTKNPDDLIPTVTVVAATTEPQPQKADFPVPSLSTAKPTVLELSTKEVDKGGGCVPGPLKPVRKLFDNKDKIVSPVIPQPGAWYVGHHPLHRHRKHHPPKPSSQSTPKFKKENQRFQYGNYNQYYGYRNLGQSREEVDPRLKLLSRTNPLLFTDKDVLDVGCNVGAVTVTVAKDYGARKVVGIDIDKSLINRARLNLLKLSVVSPSGKKFPVMMPMRYGSLDAPCVSSSCTFPHNVSFVQGNYVLETDVLLNLEKPQFDVILCFSVTKWFHLNFGDDGLKRVFARMYAQLRPGGKLVLEPQPWPSYKKRKNLSETIWKNFKSIKLLPTMFNDYLLSEVGFTKCETVGAPFNPVKGFQRPIKIYTKPEEETTLPKSIELVEQPPTDELLKENKTPQPSQPLEVTS